MLLRFAFFVSLELTTRNLEVNASNVLTTPNAMVGLILKSSLVIGVGIKSPLKL